MHCHNSVTNIIKHEPTTHPILILTVTGKLPIDFKSRKYTLLHNRWIHLQTKQLSFLWTTLKIKRTFPITYNYLI